MARQVRRVRRLTVAGINRLKACLLALCLAALPAWAQAQDPDKLLVDGQKVDLWVFPLAQWLDAHPNALPERKIDSPHNWRGYTGFWEVRDGRLWLVGLTQLGNGPPRKTRTTQMALTADGKSYSRELPASYESWPEDLDIMPVVFGGPGPVLADWFSGTLVAAREEAACIERFGSNLPCFEVIWVEQGEVGRRVELDLDQLDEFKCVRFAAYQQTPRYAERLQEARQYAGDDAEKSVFDADEQDYLSLDVPSSVTPLDAAACRRLRD